ncbi:MAG: hypothetical protein LHV68_11140 [Elusimicrobia bacterium]|nr:hypothetical protein [Candidatus Liberimonas magnetica]
MTENQVQQQPHLKYYNPAEFTEKCSLITGSTVKEVKNVNQTSQLHIPPNRQKTGISQACKVKLIKKLNVKNPLNV